MKLRTEISWWIPGGRLVYRGSPKTRSEWVRLTWRGYLAYWKMARRIVWLRIKMAADAQDGGTE